MYPLVDWGDGDVLSFAVGVVLSKWGGAVWGNGAVQGEGAVWGEVLSMGRCCPVGEGIVHGGRELLCRERGAVWGGGAVHNTK